MKLKWTQVFVSFSLALSFIFSSSVLAYHQVKSKVRRSRYISPPPKFQDFTGKHLNELREEAKDLFLHGWNSYIDKGFPYDEIRPISCRGLGPDDDIMNIGLNDGLGDFALTLIDSMDMFPMMNDQINFEKAVRLVKKFVNFNTTSTVQVFETTIRVMGGLLTSHIYASSDKLNHKIKNYDGFLLNLAQDLGDRLLPAFESDSGIPFPRINFKKGINFTQSNELQKETCTAGAGSLILEFTLLSRLTGDPVYEKVSKRAFYTLWINRSKLNLLPMSIEPNSGKWLSSMTGTGASIDSFYEYALKQAILFGDNEMMKIFETLYESLRVHSLSDWIFRNIDAYTGTKVNLWIDSLAAFLPGIQVLYGDIEEAVKTHLVYYKIWNTFAGIPERWNSEKAVGTVDNVVLEWYPLRPELIESTYYLYQSTKDPFYLHVGKRIMNDIKTRYKTKCGFSGIRDVRTGKLDDRMESFVLSETLKYLYLLFDVKNDLNNVDSNFVFSTEAHPFFYDKETLNFTKMNDFDLEFIFVEDDIGSNFTDSVDNELKDISNSEPNNNNLNDTLSSNNVLTSSALSNDKKIKSKIKRSEVKIFRTTDNTISTNFWRLYNPFQNIFKSDDYKLSKTNEKINKTEKFNRIINSGTTNLTKILSAMKADAKIREEKFLNGLQFQRDRNHVTSTVTDTTADNNEFLPYSPDFNSYQCPVIKKSKTLYSQISSWEDFYYLDQQHEYKKPWFLGRRTARRYFDIDLDIGYNKRYVNPNSICPAYRNNELVEMIIGNVENSNSVKLYPIFNNNTVIDLKINYYENNDVDFYVHSLNGLRLELERIFLGSQLIKKKHFKNPYEELNMNYKNRNGNIKRKSIFYAKQANGLEIKGNLYVNRTSLEKNINSNVKTDIGVNDDGMITIHGEAIINILIDST